MDHRNHISCDYDRAGDALAISRELELRSGSGRVGESPALRRTFAGFSLSDLRARQKRKRTPKKKTTSIAPKRYLQTRTIEAGLNLVKELLKHLHFKRAVIIAEFGFDDPAETGQVYGALLPIMYSVNSPAGFKLVAQPQFDHRCLKGEADVHIHVTPVSLVIPILGFVWQTFGPKR